MGRTIPGVVGNTGRVRQYLADRVDEGWEKAVPLGGTAASLL